MSSLKKILYLYDYYPRTDAATKAKRKIHFKTEVGVFVLGAKILYNLQKLDIAMHGGIRGFIFVVNIIN